MSRRIQTLQPVYYSPCDAYCMNHVRTSPGSRDTIYVADNKHPLSLDSLFFVNKLEPLRRHKELVLARRQLSRRQHTLETLCSRTSRSRSPIVVRMDPTIDPMRQQNYACAKIANGRSENAPIAGPDRIPTPIPSARYDERSDVCDTEAPVSERATYRLGQFDSKAVDESGVQISLSSLNSILDGPVEYREQQIGNTPVIRQAANSDNGDRKRLVGDSKQDPTISSRLSASSSLPSISAASSNNGLNGYADSVSDRYNVNWRRDGSQFSDEYSDRRKRCEILNGFEIVWLDLTYSVMPGVLEDPRWGWVNKLFHKEPRTILKGVSGGLKSGQMVALMGPSGAGKTCLLESIAGLRTTGIGGRMCLRGRRSAQIVIVPQYDDFLPQFSVEETITYGSRMKNPPDTDHKKVVDEVIKQFGLECCRHTNINRCSGGQRKRVAIAQELTSRPNILILDEPTSGLDSSCCYQTMRVLKEALEKSVMSEQPMAIVSTIHQPSAKVFKMFDLVYLLGKTGLMAYSGTPGDVVGAIRDITGLECPKYSNPADFIIELVSYDYGEAPVERLIEFEREKARRFVRNFDRVVKPASRPRSPSASNYQLLPRIVVTPQVADEQPGVAASPSAKGTAAGAGNRLTTSSSDSQLLIGRPSNRYAGDAKHLEHLEGRLAPASHVAYETNVTVPLRKATQAASQAHPFFWHVWVHLNRSFLQSIRDPVLNSMRILIHLGFALLIVVLFGQKSGQTKGCPVVLGLPTEITDPNNESLVDLADNVTYLFMCIMLITYVSLMSTVLTFPIDIKTVGKEYKNGWYSTLTYFIGKNVADLPFITLYPVVYCCIVWFVTDQPHDQPWRFASFTGLIVINALNSQSFGLILGALFVNSVASATFLGPIMTIPWYLFTGFTKRVHRLPPPFKFASNFLFTRYVFEGLLKTAYGYGRCNCSAFLDEYDQLRYAEAARLGQLVSAEKLSSLDYYDGLEQVAGGVVGINGHNETAPAAAAASSWLAKTVDAASTVFADGGAPDADGINLASLIDANVKASSIFSFGLDFEPTCPKDYEPYVVQDFRIQQRTLQDAFVSTLCILGVIRALTFFLVSWKIRTRQL